MGQSRLRRGAGHPPRARRLRDGAAEPRRLVRRATATCWATCVDLGDRLLWHTIFRARGRDSGARGGHPRAAPVDDARRQGSCELRWFHDARGGRAGGARDAVAQDAGRSASPASARRCSAWSSYPTTFTICSSRTVITKADGARHVDPAGAPAAARAHEADHLVAGVEELLRLRPRSPPASPPTPGSGPPRPLGRDALRPRESPADRTTRSRDRTSARRPRSTPRG